MTETLVVPARPRVRVRWIARRFYLLFALLVAVAVLYGFSRTIDRGLLHPKSPPPFSRYLHAAVYFGWIALLLVQAGLVQARKVKLHRRLGWFGVAFAVVLLFSGTWTAMVGARRQILRGDADVYELMLAGFLAMVEFAVLFGLGVWLRKRGDLHRRLMFLAAICITPAAFARYPDFTSLPDWPEVGVVALILVAMLRDLIVDGRVHRVWVGGLAFLLACFTVVRVVGVTEAWKAAAIWLLG